MLSKVTGVARLATDVELRYLPNGTAIANLNLVNSSKRKNAQGAQVEDTCFINATVFGKLSEIANQYLKKGSQIYFMGELKQDSWTAQDGAKKSKHSIVIESFEMLGSKEQTTQSTATPTTNENENISTQKEKIDDVPEIDIDEDDIPF